MYAYMLYVVWLLYSTACLTVAESYTQKLFALPECWGVPEPSPPYARVEIYKFSYCIILNAIAKYYNNIIDHINKIISSQFGFLKHRSVVQQLLLLFDSVCINHQTDVLYLDFRKAFDSVPHNELLQKLKTELKTVGIYGYSSSSIY